MSRNPRLACPSAARILDARTAVVVVVCQCLNLFKLAVVQRNQHSRGAPRVHGLVYNISDGLLKKVPVDFRGYADAFRDVYSLYDTPVADE